MEAVMDDGSIFAGLAQSGDRCGVEIRHEPAERRFGVSESAAIKRLQRVERTRGRKPVGAGGHRPSALKPCRAFIEAALAHKPDTTLQALCRRFLAEERTRFAGLVRVLMDE
jgi:transposase